MRLRAKSPCIAGPRDGLPCARTPWVIATFLLILKRGNGVVHLHEINPYGAIQPRLESYDWTLGWSNVESFSIAGVTYLFPPLLRRCPAFLAPSADRDGGAATFPTSSTSLPPTACR
jgi:hypothetical protein